MKKSVLERSLFAASAPKSESRGILSGIADEVEMEEERDEYEDRTPDNLEIIANNLRGDIRSMDERYMELAQMVGEAAFETPEEVVALMQSQLAQQQQPPMPAPPAPAQQGIAGLPGASAPPPGGIMAGIAGSQPSPPQGPPGVPMPPQGGMPQGMPAPVGMAEGGLVYRSNGSGPNAETGRRTLGFMKYLDPGTIPDPRSMPPRSVPIPRVQLQQTGPMTGFLSSEGAQYLQGGAGRAGTLPSRIPPALRASTALSQLPQTIVPFTRELGRTMMSTPGGRVATGIGAAAAMAYPFLGGGGSEGGGEGGPEYSEVPGVDAEGRYRPQLRTLENMPGTPEQRKAVRETGLMGPEYYAPRLGYAEEAIEGATPGAMMPIEGPPEPPVVRREFPSVKAEPPAPKTERDIYRDRVKEKMDIYAEFLGSDPEMRKAQALFMLAEAALNVAGATGRSTAERLSKGLKGLPAGMAALGAEAEKERRAIASAAITSVEQDMSEERKIAGAIAREMAKKGTNIPPKVASIFSSLKARFPNEDPQKLLQESFDIDNGTLTRSDKTGETLDTTTGQVYRSPYKPLNQNSVGYLDPNMPYVRTTNETLAPATPGERENLLKRRGELQERIEGSNQMISMIYGDTIGFLPTIQSGVSKLTLATVGDVGLGLTDVQKNAIRDNLRLNREELIKTNLRNAGRPAVYDQQKMEQLIRDPNALFQSQELLLSNVANLQREDINELARIDSQLFGAPLKQLERVPIGSKTDPIAIGPNAMSLLDQVFTNRPNAAIWTMRPDGKTVRITGKEYFAQRQAQ